MVNDFLSRRASFETCRVKPEYCLIQVETGGVDVDFPDIIRGRDIDAIVQDSLETMLLEICVGSEFQFRFKILEALDVVRDRVSQN